MQGIALESALSTILLAIVGAGGDMLLAMHFSYQKRAIIDNMVHGITGVLTWHIISTTLPRLPRTRQIFEMFLCGLMASIIDLDHFAAARSFRIRDAIGLSSRPLLHCTTVTVGSCVLGLVLAHLHHWMFVERICWLMMAALISHHLRDAARRGFWLYPFGSTPPVPYPLYILATMLLPYMLGTLFKWTRLHKAFEPMNISLV